MVIVARFLLMASMKKISLALLSLASAVLITGCGPSSKITKENYDKVKEGMTRAEVVSILGEPTGSEVVGQINDTEIKGPVWEGQGLKIVTMFSQGGKDGKLQVKRLDKE
jgi:hypothetical protein